MNDNPHNAGVTTKLTELYVVNIISSREGFFKDLLSNIKPEKIPSLRNGFSHGCLENMIKPEKIYHFFKDNRNSKGNLNCGQELIADIYFLWVV